jgi:hypothetical protein
LEAENFIAIVKRRQADVDALQGETFGISVTFLSSAALWITIF